MAPTQSDTVTTSVFIIIFINLTFFFNIYWFCWFLILYVVLCLVEIFKTNVHLYSSVSKSYFEYVIAFYPFSLGIYLL